MQRSAKSPWPEIFYQRKSIIFWLKIFQPLYLQLSPARQALTFIFISGPLQSYPESTDQQAASLQNAEFLLKASGPLRAPGVSVRRKLLCTKCNAWSDGRLGNHNQQRRECVQRGLLLPAPPESHVQCTAGEFRLARAFRPGIPIILSSRHNHAELQIFLFEARRLSLSKPLLCGEWLLRLLLLVSYCYTNIPQYLQYPELCNRP